jgi:hypothetical protein
MELRRQLPDVSEALRMMPQILQQFVQQASEGKFRLKIEQAGLEELRSELRAGARRRDATVICGAALLGGLVWLAVGPSPWPGAALCVAGLVGALAVRRSGR